MVTIPGPRDVQVVSPRVTRTVRSVPYQRADQVSTAGADALRQAGNAVVELTNRISDQRIENEIVDVEMRQRKEIDALAATFENDTDYETFEQRFADQAGEITARNLESLSSQRARNLWQRRANENTYRAQQAISNLSRQRGVEMARAGLITNLQTAEATLQDDNATAEARALALQAIEGQIATAQARGVLAADDAAERLARARNANLEFERTRGMRARAQAEEDRIWSESGGDLRVAYEMARELEPLMRDTVMDRIEARYSQGERARENSTRAAMEQALTHLEGGGSLDGLPTGVRDVITRAGRMDDLRTYIRNRAGGGSIANEASEAVRDGILAAAVEDPAGFARLDLTPLLPQMNADDRAAVVRQQQYRRGEAPATDGGDDLVDQSFTEVWSIAEGMAQARGVRIEGNNGANAQRRGQLRTFLMRATRRFVQQNARQPTMAEREEIVNSALLRAQSGERVFENRIVREGGVRIGDRNFGGRDAPRIRITIGNIPQWEAERIARLYRQQYGRMPRPDEIETIYSAETAQEAE